MKYSKNTTGSYITWKLKQRRQGDKTMIFIHLEPYCFSKNSRVAVFYWTIFIIRSGCNGKIYPPAMLVFSEKLPGLENRTLWRCTQPHVFQNEKPTPMFQSETWALPTKQLTDFFKD